MQTYAQHLIKMAAGRETLPFEEAWTAAVVASVNEKLENMIYQGDTANGNQFDGLIKIASADSTVVKVAGDASLSAYAYIKKIAAAIPVKVKNPSILVSPSLYREFMQDLVTANLFHYNPGDGQNEYLLPGTNIKVKAVDGLQGAEKDAAFALDESRVVYGCDAESDDQTFELWYSRDNKEFRLDIDFIAGVQYAFGEEIVFAQRG